MPASLDLEEQLRFYGSYHHHPVNVAVHVICVPLLLMTGLMLASNSPNLAIPDWLPDVPINVGTVFSLLYSTFYILMEPVAGTAVAPLIVSGTLYANHLLDEYGAQANKWAIAVHLVSWIAQFIGHGKFEGRAPALFDNLVQALFLAPFFVWMEILFRLGYRPELKARLDKAVQHEIQKFKASKAPDGQTSGGLRNGVSK